MSGREHVKGRKRSDLSVWRIDYLALLEEKMDQHHKEMSERWQEWHNEYIQFMDEKVPQEDHKQFHNLLMDVMNDRHWCLEHGVNYEDPSIQLAALALCKERYGHLLSTMDTTEQQIPSSSELPEESVSGKTIMVIDDDEGIREVLEDIIKQLGHKVITFESGEAALIETQKCAPDMVFLDYSMPEKNGLEVLRELMTISPNLKVVMLTGYANLDIAKEAVDTGVIDYVSKPLDMTLVSEIVEDVLG